MEYDIENDELGLYCSFQERAQEFILELERELAGRRRAGFIDTYLFVPHVEVLRLMQEHFKGRATVWYLYCGDTGECDDHDAHIHWERVKA